MNGERQAGGIWCHEVLALLPDYLDGELESGTSASIEVHLRDCDFCERFGGRYRETVGALRRALLTDAGFDGSRAAVYLHRRLRKAIDSSTALP